MVEYWGWICAKETDGELLRSLGVRGEMKYNKESSVFEFCVCDEAAIEALMLCFPTFWPGSFTAVDLNGEQLPYEKQKYWHYPHAVPLNHNTALVSGLWMCGRCDAMNLVSCRRCSNCLAYRTLFDGEGYATLPVSGFVSEKKIEFLDKISHALREICRRLKEIG